MNYIFFFILSILIASSQGFLRSTQIFIPNKKISNTRTNIILLENTLEAIVKNKAILSSIFVNLRSEVTLERILIEVDNLNGSNALFYMSIIITYVYGEYRFSQGLALKSDKYRNIPLYKRTEKMFREIFFVILFVIFKDVRSAS